MLKYLCIAVTALSLTVCLLVIALWVRSYWWADAIIRGTISNRTETVIASNHGAIVFGRRVPPASSSLPPEDRWGYLSDKARPVNRHFGWIANNRQIRIQFPTWLPVLLAASLAAAPWIRWRFSLRTLLIVTMLVAVGLGMVAYLAR
jgi:hypothetical protein